MGFFESLFKVLTFGLFTLLQDWLAPETPSEAIKTEKNGSNKPIPVNYGENILGAIKIHKYVTDTPEESDNDLLHIIAVFCEGEVESVDELFFNEISENDEKFSGGRLAGGKWYEKHVYTGTPNQPASAAAVSGIPNWTIDHKLSGLCYAYIVLQLPFEESDERRDVWRGEPRITARIKGKKVYDPRTATTAFSANPVLCIRDFITNPIYGLGLPESFVVDSEIVRIANACDEGVSTTQTITEYIVDPEPGSTPIPQTTTTTVNHPRFSCNLVLQTEDNPLENFNKILRTFRGIAQDMTSSAKLSYETTIEETYGVGTTVNDLFHFNSDTMLDDFEFDSGDIKDRFNVVEVKFRNRLKEFEDDSVFYPADSDPLKAQWLAEDNGIEQKGDFNVSGITSKAEALQWAEVVAKRSRFSKSVSVTGMPITIMVEVGDIVAVDSQMNGWTKKPFRVMEKELQDDDSVAFKLREHEDAIYPWSGRSFSDTIGGTWLGDPNNLAPVTGITLTPDPTLSKTGTLSWSYGANAFIRGYQVRLKDGAGNLLYDVQRPSRSWLVPLIDAGSYVAEVYAVSTTGATSPTAAYAFTLAAPVQPSSITLTPRDWEIEAAAQLAGIGLGTVFEYDIVAGDGTGYTPASKGRATTFTFTGLLPDTLYTVFARAINAYGISDWISASATTTNTGAQVEPHLGTIRDELAAVELIVDDLGVWSPAIEVSEVFTNVFNDFELTEDNRVTLEVAQDAGKTAEGNLLAINGIRAEIDDPVTGLEATFQFAQQIETTVDGNASAINLLENDVYDANTGLSATNQIAQTAETTANNNASAITQITSRVDSAESDISANAALIQGVQLDADSNASAISALDARVENNEQFASAQLILNSEYDAELNTLSARAFLGTDVNDRVTGIVIGDTGVQQQILFLSDNVGFVDNNGTLKIYYDLANERYVFDGEIVAQTGTFGGTLNAATMNGGTINIGSGTFTVDALGNMVANSADLTGGLKTASGTGNRVEIGTDSTYEIWIGSGAKTDGNGVFWVKPNGTGFIKGEFFQGEIIETRYGSNSGSEPVTATAVGHNSAGNTVEISGIVQGFDSTSGDFGGQSRTLTVTIKRDTTTLATKTMTAVGVYDSTFNVTRWGYVYNVLQLDTGTTSGVTYDYSITGDVNAGAAILEVDFKTFENKLG